NWGRFKRHFWGVLSRHRQPRMLQEDGRPDLVLVYTGETYNYRELRQQLAGLVHRMNTSSDTEVVLHRPREWGSSAGTLFSRNP
ncbi:MAG: hypothetical protein E5Y88_29700, partial [Mesorhizobium sp.]